MTVIPGRLMSLEEGHEQLNHYLGFLQIGWGVLLPAEEIGCAERLIAEDKAAH